MQTMKFRFTFSHMMCACAMIFATANFAAPADAGNVSFSNFFQSTQTAGDPANLFGPHTTPAPNTLVFPNPGAFAASATGLNDIDITDGLLSFDVDADPGTYATGLNISELITYSFFPPTATDNVVQAIISGGVTITEISGVAVAGPTILFNIEETYTLADVAPLSSGNANVVASVPFNLANVTGFQVVLDNRLSAFSEFGSSFIDKKRVDITVDTDMIPEPTTMILAAFGFVGMLAKRRVR